MHRWPEQWNMLYRVPSAGGETEAHSSEQAQVRGRVLALLALSQLARPRQTTPPGCLMLPRPLRTHSGERTALRPGRTHHVHDLQETQGEVDGEWLRVVGHGPLQGVVVLDQLLVELPLELALQGHLRKGEPGGLFREGQRGCAPRPLPVTPAT